VSRSRRALVLLPERPIDGAVTARLIEYVQHRFAPAATVIMVRDDLRSTLPEPVATRAQTYTREEISSFFTPRSSLLRKLRTGTFDIAFDLNREFSLPSAFLCRASSAPLRVSFLKENADRFYNFQVRTTNDAPPAQAYDHLLRCLDMF
jgi:hypothetical protein